MARPGFGNFILQEHSTLTSLSTCSSCLPTLDSSRSGAEHSPPFLLLRPIGAPLTTDLVLGGSWFAKALPDLVKELRLCHQAGFVHCDLRPENIMMVAAAPAGAGLDDEERPRLILLDWWVGLHQCLYLVKMVSLAGSKSPAFNIEDVIILT